MIPDEAGIIQSKLVAYASQQAHSSAERAALLGGVKVSILTILLIKLDRFTIVNMFSSQ